MSLNAMVGPCHISCLSDATYVSYYYGNEVLIRPIRPLYKFLHAQKVFTTPYHPQSDSLVERFNRTLINMLSKLFIVGDKDKSHSGRSTVIQDNILMGIVEHDT